LVKNDNNNYLETNCINRWN